jgi:hypothetical protein
MWVFPHKLYCSAAVFMDCCTTTLMALRSRRTCRCVTQLQFPDCLILQQYCYVKIKSRITLELQFPYYENYFLSCYRFS